MAEISINEYVRTPEEGFIGKLVKINKGVLNYYKIDVGREIKRTNGMSDNYIYSRDGFGLKHSKNIIDLIEVDDIGIMNCYGLKVKKFITKDDISELKFRNYELLSIITKEQIKQIEYRIKE